MKVDYKTPLKVVVNSLYYYYHIKVEVEETNGLDFFPTNIIGINDESKTFTLRFNPKVLTILALYNLALGQNLDTEEAIIRYSLFYACLEMDDYEQARIHLDAFRKEMIHLSLHTLTEDNRENIRAQLLTQLYFLFFHESFHIIFHHQPNNCTLALDTTRQLLLDIKTEWEDGFSLITKEELLNHPKTKQHINNMIPQELSGTEQQEMEESLHRELSKNTIRPNYIDYVLQYDKTLVEEITCDRQAWLNLLPVFQDDGATEQDILQIHLWIFTVFNAMDFNKFLQSQFVPSLHGKKEYDGMRVVLRHKAFKALLRQYNPDIYKLLKSEYLDLNDGVDAIFRSAVMTLHRHADDLSRLYAKHSEDSSYTDFTQIMRLEQELSEVSDMLY